MRTLNSAGGSNHQKMEPEVKQELRAKVTDAMSQVNQEKKTAANLAKSIKQRIASPEAEPKAKARARGKAKAKAKAGSNGDGDEEAAKSRKGKKGKGEPSTEPTKPTDSGNKKRGRAAPKPKAKARVSKKAKAWFVFALSQTYKELFLRCGDHDSLFSSHYSDALLACMVLPETMAAGKKAADAEVQASENMSMS